MNVRRNDWQLQSLFKIWICHCTYHKRFHMKKVVYIFYILFQNKYFIYLSTFPLCVHFIKVLQVKLIVLTDIFMIFQHQIKKKKWALWDTHTTYTLDTLKEMPNTMLKYSSGRQHIHYAPRKGVRVFLWKYKFRGAWFSLLMDLINLTLTRYILDMPTVSMS